VEMKTKTKTSEEVVVFEFVLTTRWSTYTKRMHKFTPFTTQHLRNNDEEASNIMKNQEESSSTSLIDVPIRTGLLTSLNST